jgi:hypothetical protein
LSQSQHGPLNRIGRVARLPPRQRRRFGHHHDLLLGSKASTVWCAGAQLPAPNKTRMPINQPTIGEREINQVI